MYKRLLFLLIKTIIYIYENVNDSQNITITLNIFSILLFLLLTNSLILKCFYWTLYYINNKDIWLDYTNIWLYLDQEEEEINILFIIFLFILLQFNYIYIIFSKFILDYFYVIYKIIAKLTKL